MDETEADKQKQSQVDKFREAARELETDDREDAFDALVKQIAKAEPAQRREKAGDQN